jgi:hypothetical protein
VTAVRRPGVLLAAIVCVILLLVGRPAAAQTAAREPLATLATWADGVWTSLLDRDGGWAGRLSDEGTFQRFNPDEDREYRLDMHTALFSPSEDARWAFRETGLRAAAGSLTRPDIAQRLEWRDRFAISSAWEFEGNLLRERSREASRDHFRTGVFWQPNGPGSWETGATLGLHFFKASADVELLVRRTWSGEDVARGYVDVRIGLLDLFNDVVFKTLGVGADEADAHFDYIVQPVAIRADGSWSMGLVRVEARGGASNRSSVFVTFPAAGDPPYELSERVAFAGGLVELQASSTTTLAALASIARADTERLGETPSTSDLSLREVTHMAGFRARQTLGASLSLEADLLWTRRPEDRRVGWRAAAGPQLSVEHRDRELFGGLALVRRPVRGWTGRLLYSALDRDADPLMPQLTARNTRLTTDGGYRFASGFEVTVAVRWELDRTTEYTFDGGQLRVTTGVP